MKKMLFTTIMSFLSLNSNAFAGRDAALAVADSNRNPGPSYNHLEVLSFAGNGCPGYLQAQLNMFNQFGVIPRSLEVNFTSNGFILDPGEGEISCTVNLKTNVPLGWRLVVDQSEIHGTYFEFDHQKIKVQNTIKIERDLIRADDLIYVSYHDESGLTFAKTDLQSSQPLRSVCNPKNISINTRLIPFPSTSDVKLRIDKVKIPLKWERC